MWGDSESASKNTLDPILKLRKERFLIFPLACDLVLAVRGRPGCQTSKTRMCARLEIRSGRLVRTSRRARAVRAKCLSNQLSARSLLSHLSSQHDAHVRAARNSDRSPRSHTVMGIEALDDSPHRYIRCGEVRN